MRAKQQIELTTEEKAILYDVIVAEKWENGRRNTKKVILSACKAVPRLAELSYGCMAEAIGFSREAVNREMRRNGITRMGRETTA